MIYTIISLFTADTCPKYLHKDRQIILIMPTFPYFFQQKHQTTSIRHPQKAPNTRPMC